MDSNYLCRAKTTSKTNSAHSFNHVWVEGDLIISAGRCYIHPRANAVSVEGELGKIIIMHEVDPTTICRCTGKEYKDGEITFEGDIFESQASGDVMILRYGKYQAFCPVDQAYMDAVGFYAECKGHPHMPIGDLGDYAKKKGTVYENPELMEEAIC